MSVTRRTFLGAAATTAVVLLTACTERHLRLDSSMKAEAKVGTKSIEEVLESGDVAAAQLTGTLALNQNAWNHDSKNGVFWQIGIPYCNNPSAPDIQKLGIFVPSAYFDAQENEDGTFTCSLGEGSFAGFSAQTAPILILSDTDGYAARRTPDRYNYRSMAEYLDAGFICVQPGYRGRRSGYDEKGNLLFEGSAPWGIADLKAAIRYVRYNARLIPGSSERIFAYGQGNGGAQSVILGASGDSSQYKPYLESMGAALKDDDGAQISDAVAGVICWNPTTCLDQANASYEWMMGQYVNNGTREDGLWTAALSQHLAERFSEYVNDVAFTDENDNALELNRSKDSVFTAGSYYDHIKGIIEESLNNFLSDTTFPYTVSAPLADDGTASEEEAEGGNADSKGNDDDERDVEADDATSASAEDGKPSDEEAETDKADSKEDDDSEKTAEAEKSAARDNGGNKTSSAREITYETAEDYIAALNASEPWVSYDKKSKTATVSSIEAFVRNCRQPDADVCAFDMLDRSSAENELFGTEESEALHFDSWTTELLQANSEEYSKLDGWDSGYVDEYASDLEALDSMGTSVTQRMNMYNPLYYLYDFYDGAGKSNVAKFWRIHSGLERTDVSLATEVNLALALNANTAAEDVEFRVVWGKGHTRAERIGDPTENAVAWIKHLLLS